MHDFNLLNNFDFVDLYITEAEMRIRTGDDQIPVPEKVKPDVSLLREECLAIFGRDNKPEFSIKNNGTIYRITVLDDPDHNPMFFVRKTKARIIPFPELGLRPDVESLIQTKKIEGLILIAGRMANGKTTTASSIVVNRLETFGGVGIVIEDPIETHLHGPHGKGICYQSAASRFEGGYKESIIRTLRTGTDLIMIGEIRDSDTATEVVNASINGHLIVSTIHSGSVKEAIEKLYNFCDVSIRKSVSEGLLLVIHQELVEGKKTDSYKRYLQTKSFILDQTARADIRREDFPSIDGLVSSQLTAQKWKKN